MCDFIYVFVYVLFWFLFVIALVGVQVELQGDDRIKVGVGISKSFSEFQAHYSIRTGNNHLYKLFDEIDIANMQSSLKKDALAGVVDEIVSAMRNDAKERRRDEVHVTEDVENASKRARTAPRARPMIAAVVAAPAWIWNKHPHFVF